MTLRLLLVAATLPVFTGLAHAELQFPKTKIELPAEAGQDPLHGEFPFRNAGKETITITSLNTSCGCTTATLEKKTYAPGESGTIGAQFAVGERSGRQNKTIVVQTDEPKDNVYELTLETDIPAVIALEPRLLVWKVGGAPDAQKVKVTFANGKTYKLVSATDASGRFIAEFATQPGAAEPTLQIKPTRTDEAVLGVILVDFVDADGVKLTRSVLMRVVKIP